MDEGAGLSEVVQELVAKTPALPGVRHQAGNVQKLHGYHPRSTIASRVPGNALGVEVKVRAAPPDERHSSICLYGGERIVSDLHVCQGGSAEERGLAHVRFADDAYLHIRPFKGMGRAIDNAYIQGAGLKLFEAEWPSQGAVPAGSAQGCAAR